MERAAQGAIQLMVALHDAAALFREFGYAQFLAHQSVRWRLLNRVGGAVAPIATVGVVFDLNDAEHTEVCLYVDVWWRDDQFVVEGDATVDDPEHGGTGNQRFLTDLPATQSTSLDECLAALHSYTTRLCSYTSVLDELGVPRTQRRGG